MIELSAAAARHVQALRRHFEQLDRQEAVLNLRAALVEAAVLIERDPSAGIAAPRPYPQAAKPGVAWIKVRRYWIAYTTTGPLVILGVFHDTANIPNRFRPGA